MGKYIEGGNKFTYLGSVVTDKRGTYEGVKNRIGKARHATTWRTTKKTTRMLLTFIKKCLKYILKTKWQDETTKKKIWRRTDQHSIRKEIARRKWTWIGHILRKQTNNVKRQALDWNPQGKNRQIQNYLEETSKRGSKETWNHLERNDESSK